MNHTTYGVTNSNEPLLDFGIQLIATLIGVGFGFWLPILYEKRKKNSETKSTKKHLIESAIIELEAAQRGLIEHDISKSKWDDAKRTFVGRYGIVSVPIIHSALSTGNVNLLGHVLREWLVRVSDRAEHYNWCVEQMLTFYTTPIFATGKGSDEANDLIFRAKLQSDSLKDEVGTTFGLSERRFEKSIVET